MISSLQIGRGIASIFVVLFHLGGVMESDKYFGINGFYKYFSFGSSGVEFFFVLSGFIIYNAHKDDLSKPHKVVEYLKKRFIRIFPIYWLIFILSLGLIYFTSLKLLAFDIIALIKSFLLIPQDINIVGGTGVLIVPVAWSLQYELMFYLIFLLFIINKKIGLFCICLAILFLKLFTFEEYTYIYKFIFNQYIILFFIGIFISWLIENKPNVFCTNIFGFLGFLIFFIISVSSVLEITYFKEFKIFLYGMSFGFIIFFFVQIEKYGYNFFKFKKLNIIGNASYSLYLLHYPLIIGLSKILLFIGLEKLGVMGAMISFIIIFTICVYSSVLFHVWIEKPLIKYCKKILFYKSEENIK